LNKDINTYIGIDIGGTKIAIGMVDEKGNVYDFQIIPTEVELGYNHALKKITGLCNKMISKYSSSHRFVALGIACPGPIDHVKGIIVNPANLWTWEGANIVNDIKEIIEIPVFLEHDTDAAALAENWVGVGNNSQDLVYITVSTGIGAGLILGGKLQRGSFGAAGELGHTIVKPDGRRCQCGAYGCLDEMASGRILPKRAKNLKQNYKINGSLYLFKEYIQIINPEFILDLNKLDSAIIAYPEFQNLEKSVSNGGLSKMLENNVDISSKEIGDFALSGDAFATFLIIESAFYLGLGIVNLISTLDPQAVVLGGGLMNLWEIYNPMICFTIRMFLKQVPFGRNKILRAKLSEKVGLIGAARAAMLNTILY
jgi:glucokinase